MPRYIEVEKIRPYKGFFEKVDNVPKFYEWLETLPTADVVEVVRCKECKRSGLCEMEDRGRRYDDNFYCAEGELKQ